ncbi:hypothetical protein [Leptothermofonsia sp. ETS-13]|uniref:hypothetical protein n=1 Tax=Leptothermofonsia sp. ETS-13 TaxID=3035696 RepID=UPI003BA1E404
MTTRFIDYTTIERVSIAPKVLPAMNTFDDAALILQFVKREGALASNQNLRIEPAFDSVQLLARRGGLLATFKTPNNLPTVLVRRGSEYYNLIHRVLVENCFIPMNPSETSKFTKYERSQIPDGYKLNCTEARFLWKEWWTKVRQGNRNNIQTDLVIFCRNTWYPIREIVCSHRTLFITTLVSEFVYQGSELIVWLSKESDQTAENQAAEKLPQALPIAPPNQPNLNKPVFRQSPGRTAFVGKDLPPLASSAVRGSLSGNGENENSENSTTRPDLRQVLKFRQGKLYITTAIGEIVVEGAHLKFWLNDEEPAIAPKTVNIETYRDREAQVVNI